MYLQSFGPAPGDDDFSEMTSTVFDHIFKLSQFPWCNLSGAGDLHLKWLSST